VWGRVSLLTGEGFWEEAIFSIFELKKASFGAS